MENHRLTQGKIAQIEQQTLRLQSLIHLNSPKKVLQKANTAIEEACQAQIRREGIQSISQFPKRK